MYGSYDWGYLWSSTWSFGINHLWQSTVFSAFAFVAVSMLRGAPARLRYLIWIVASLKFIFPTALIAYLASWLGVDLFSIFLSVAWATGDPVGLVGRQHQIFHIAGSANPAFLQAQPLFVALALIWFVGTVACLARWMKSQISFSRDLAKDMHLQQGREVEILRALRQKLNLRKEIQIIVSDRITGPGVWGISKPVLVFPQDMSRQLGDSELEAVLLHELAHVTRRDNLISSIHMFVCSLFWFHPVVWWIDRRLLAERERACDERVLESGGVSRVYASGLLKVLRFGLGFRMAGVSCAGGSSLRKRIDHIISCGRKERFSTCHKIVIASMLAVFVFLSVAAIDIGDCERTQLQKEWTAIQPPAPDVCSGNKS